MKDDRSGELSERSSQGWPVGIVGWDELTRSKTLVLGIGGGSDGITAAAICHALRALGADTSVVAGNTKRRAEPDWHMSSARIGEIPAKPLERTGRGLHGGTGLDRMLAMDGERMLGVVCERGVNRKELAAELAALEFEHVIAVDTGGDVLARYVRSRIGRGRDLQMLATLEMAYPDDLTLLVVAPGADGESTREQLVERARAAHALGRWRGVASIEPLIRTYRDHAASIPSKRTPSIILEAWSKRPLPVGHQTTIQRERYPTLPTSWLGQVLVIDASRIDT